MYTFVYISKIHILFNNSYGTPILQSAFGYFVIIFKQTALPGPSVYFSRSKTVLARLIALYRVRYVLIVAIIGAYIHPSL